MDLTGKIVGHYEITRKLGEGGMGAVYRAKDLTLKRSVALKFLSEELSHDPEAVERFRREARATAALSHPHICTIYEIGDYEGQPFIAMELVEGQTLRDYIKGRRLETLEIVRLAIQIAGALEAAHATRIVHRDVKPRNIFITKAGDPKILDFGLAKPLRERRRDPERRAAEGRRVEIAETTWATAQECIAPESISTPGIILGTAPYMSPEQACGEEVDHRSDIFSFGAVLYEMATRQPAFPGKTVREIFRSICSRRPPAPSELNPDLPTDLEDIISKALEKDPKARYQSASEMCADLAHLKRRLETGRVEAISRPSTPREMAKRSPVSQFARAAVERIRKVPRIRTIALAAGFAVLAGTAALFIRLGTPYYPVIVLGEFRSESDAVSPGLVQFMLQRTLQQFPALLVVSKEEAARAREIAKAQRQAADRGEGKGWLARLMGQLRPEFAGPALLVSGVIRGPSSTLRLSIAFENRGDTGSFVVPVHGVDELLSKKIDELALRVVKLYDPYHPATAEGRPPGNVSIVQLLTPHWDALSHYWLGVQAWSRLDGGLAEREFLSALQIDPSFALAHVSLAEVRVFQERWEEARKEILAAEQLSSSLTETDKLRIKALHARVSSNPFDERDGLRKLIGMNPTRKEYVFELAESYFHTGDVEDAIHHYREALELDEKYALAYNHLGYCHAWKGDFQKARDALNSYRDIDKSANAYDSLGDVCMHAGEYASAAEMKRRALALDPTLVYAKRGLAFISMLRGWFAEAEQQLQSDLATTPDDPQKAQLFGALAFLHCQKQDLAAAASACQRGLSLLTSGGPYDERRIELTWLSGIIQLQRNNLAGANAALAKLQDAVHANSINPMNFKPMYKFWLLLQLDIQARQQRAQDVETAFNDLDWVRDKLGYWGSPYDRTFCFDLGGVALQRVHRYPQAEQAYRNALAYNPHFALARLHLARLLSETGRKAEAHEEAQRFLAGWKDADSNLPELGQARQL